MVVKSDVVVALLLVELSAVKFCNVVEPVASKLAKLLVPVKDGDPANTTAPVPVSSLRSPARSADVWILVLER